jgi:magnesium chelatase subunit I
LSFPFSAVVGADDVKLALCLVAIEPRLGGLLVKGEKGSAKTTLIRALAKLLGPEAALVDVPLSCTEDRLVGSLDITSALTGSGVRFRPGLLAAADGGVLYVDEVNLLPDHLVDYLLDVAQSGVNRVERDGSPTSTQPGSC